jgi:hypothetical protein
LEGLYKHVSRAQKSVSRLYIPATQDTNPCLVTRTLSSILQKVHAHRQSSQKEPRTLQ